jgi:hypothetical protein
MGTSIDHTILLTSEEEILLQMHSRQYRTPPESSPTNSEEILVTIELPLIIPRPNTETPLCIPHIPLRRNVHNPQAMEAHNDSLVDDLAQSSVAMLVLEVLQTFPPSKIPYFPPWEQSTLPVPDSSHLTSTAENLASPLLLLFKSL